MRRRCFASNTCGDFSGSSIEQALDFVPPQTVGMRAEVLVRMRFDRGPIASAQSTDHAQEQGVLRAPIFGEALSEAMKELVGLSVGAGIERLHRAGEERAGLTVGGLRAGHGRWIRFG